ncbi:MULTISPECIES: DNA cytosine methyltransferase [Streptomyces]|uniref:DNA (cytosine-5-)-methyltransferase n=1 Tax=Streptomyces fradiae ATCC 10745 = DSM 40063 TaxID=1319510 RepID=A0A1Y2NSD8_STRFR|nr:MULTISPECIES: DNA cytosine methyltransferase [Streptomyces]KAF0647074.1 DNA methyltransferase [Streptomyces fradiae ATCC 10745 = DSM 40063]OSY50442.1 C-5 cytosine-specific DNA methylase [Streptomyces fradiae ATCC 10745 = DSM 40063]QEV12051.1 DNA cytosine methyltransferase [Streptomyces fradiae ATCC 10745 = DSM 40063]
MTLVNLRTLAADTTDGFAGAGGSSTGAVQAGIRVRTALNHWRLAVDVHNANHPDTLHDCADISQVDPRRYPTTTFAWFSPSCTNHSIAKGRSRHADATPDLFGEALPDEAAERSRATMWDVIRFAEYHRYRAIIVENVVDARQWVLWPAWIAALQALRYRFRVVYLNSMHAQALGQGAPQSRDRMYVVAWLDGERAPDFERWTRPTAHCPRCDRTGRAIQGWKNPDRQYGKYRAQYVWRCATARCHAEVFPAVRPAADAIDWAIPAQRIADRARPLAAKTMQRVRDGFAAYARPLLVPVEGREGKTARPADEPMRTCTARNETGVAVPPYVVELRGGGSTHRPVTDPLATVCASGNHHGLTVPDLVVPYYGNATARPAVEPIPTVTTVDRHGLLAGGTVATVDELGFRMLEPHEYAAAMQFPTSYIWLGNKRERVRMAGNAVTPPAARDLFAMVAEAVLGEDYQPARTVTVPPSPQPVPAT